MADIRMGESMGIGERHDEVELSRGEHEDDEATRAQLEEMAIALDSSTKRKHRDDPDQQRFTLFYQPRADLSSGRVTGAEALIRWDHPELGLVAPSRFIDQAETSGMMVPLGEWVLRTACSQAQAWQSAGSPALAISVNISRSQFESEGFVASVADALLTSSMPPARLELEMRCDTILAHPERSLATMQQLVAMGVSLSVDAFHPGDASPDALRALQLSRLKIDRELITALDEDDARDHALAAIALGKALGLRLVAVGVEIEQHRQFLRRHGCHEMQGYLLSRPLPPEGLASVRTATGPLEND